MPLIPSTGPDQTPNLATAEQFITNLSNWLLFLAIAAAVIMILVGAYYFIFSLGSTERAAKGKSIITWAVLGLVVVILSRVIIHYVVNFAVKPGKRPAPINIFNEPVK